MKFYHECFYIFFIPFMMPYLLIPLISALKEFHLSGTVGPSVSFVPALNPPKIWNFRWYLINLISRVTKVSKTVQKTLGQHLTLDFFRILPVYQKTRKLHCQNSNQKLWTNHHSWQQFIYQQHKNGSENIHYQRQSCKKNHKNEFNKTKGGFFKWFFVFDQFSQF